MRKDGSRFWANVVITALARPGRQAARVREGHARPHRAHAKPRRARARSLPRRPRWQRRPASRSFRSVSWRSWATTCATRLPRSTWARESCASGATDPVDIRVMDRMHASSLRMSRMIEQILDLTRTRLAGGLEMNLQPMDLRDTIVRIVDELRNGEPWSRRSTCVSPPLPGHMGQRSSGAGVLEPRRQRRSPRRPRKARHRPGARGASVRRGGGPQRRPADSGGASSRRSSTRSGGGSETAARRRRLVWAWVSTSRTRWSSHTAATSSCDPTPPMGRPSRSGYPYD